MACGPRRKNRPPFTAVYLVAQAEVWRNLVEEATMLPVLYCVVLVLDDGREVITPTAKPPTAPARMPNSTKMGNHSTQCLCDLRAECILHTFPPHVHAKPGLAQSYFGLGTKFAPIGSLRLRCRYGPRGCPRANLASGADFHS